ncbi:adhesion G-protein coupled receptor D1-like [Pocillopora damicornis]|uniref:adhesion G-protein coupled receptor D1-like n=1 Tax=Pocillopora damicornis TaxID=46731 RepID=UPI000F54C961|nr:adhesion G-protein coupled receptor D1-like [Pocillopora damicornis]
MSLIYVQVSNADGHCSYPNDTLAPSELNYSDCQRHLDKMRQFWHRMECGNETPTSIDKTCCRSWCRQLASLFSQTSSWRDRCFKMWGCRENEKARMPFSIILTNTTDSSYLGRIKVEQCLTLNFPAIKLTPSSEFSNKKLVDTILKEVTNSSGNKVTQEEMERTFLTVTDLEEFIGNYAQNHLNQTVPKIDIRGEHADILVRKIFHENETRVELEDDKGENYVSVLVTGLDNGSVVLCVIYKDLHEVFLTGQTDSAPVTKISNILSATIWPRSNTFRKNVTLKFKNLVDAPKRSCVFWNTSKNSWSGQGCLLTSRNQSHTECSCNHLTHFAVLMQFDRGTSGIVLTKTDEKALEILTYVGLSFSLVGISLTIISYAVLTDMSGPLSQIRVSLVASLGAGQIIFLTGSGAVENKSACVTVAAFVQYFLMAAFCWMLIEGVYLYLFVVKVYNIDDKMKVSHGFSWGLPAVVVSISLGIAAGTGPGIKSYISANFCWMSSSNGMIWIFVVFVVLIELLNTLILVRVIKEMKNMQHAKDKISEQMRLGVRACVLMIPLLGITWLFGLLSPMHKAFAYIFTIFNSTQGFLIFLLHCVKNSKIRSRFKRRITGATLTAAEIRGIKRAAQVNEVINVILPRKINVQPRNNRESGLEISEI